MTNCANLSELLLFTYIKYGCRFSDRNLDLGMPAWAFNPFLHEYSFTHSRLAQSVMCLNVDPWVGSSIPAQFHTFMEIDHEIISTVILLPSADSRRVTG